jgi:hypothetical protein
MVGAQGTRMGAMLTLPIELAAQEELVRAPDKTIKMHSRR